MAKFFKILALILVILSLFTLASRDFFLTVVIIVVALLIYHVGELMDRVAYLEDKLNEDVYEVFLMWRLCYGLENIIISTYVDEYEELVYTCKEDLDKDALEVIFKELVNDYVDMELFIDNESLYDYVQQVTMRSPVYYLSYATSEIAAMTFYTVATEEGYEVAQEMYVDLCLETPTDKLFFDTLIDVGWPNPFEEDTIERIMDAFEK